MRAFRQLLTAEYGFTRSHFGKTAHRRRIAQQLFDKTRRESDHHRRFHRAAVASSGCVARTKSRLPMAVAVVSLPAMTSARISDTASAKVSFPPSAVCACTRSEIMSSFGLASRSFICSMMKFCSSQICLAFSTICSRLCMRPICAVIASDQREIFAPLYWLIPSCSQITAMVSGMANSFMPSTTSPVAALSATFSTKIHNNASNARLQRLHAVCRECAVHQAANTRVLRRIALDDVREETTTFLFEDLLELLEEAARVLRFVAVFIGEGFRIAQHRDDIFVARHQPHAQFFVVVHRIFSCAGSNKSRWAERECSVQSTMFRRVKLYGGPPDIRRRWLQPQWYSYLCLALIMYSKYWCLKC